MNDQRKTKPHKSRPKSSRTHKGDSAPAQPDAPKKFKIQKQSERASKEGLKKPDPKKHDARPASATKSKRAKATVDKNRKGFAFLIFENRTIEDAFVPPREAQGLFHGDRVEVTLNSNGKVKAVQVLEHRFRELVGRYTPHPFPKRKSREGWVVYERKRAREEIVIPIVDRPVKDGDWVRVKLNFHSKGNYPVTGEIREVYGQELPPSADIITVSAEFNLTESHSKGADQEAKGFPAEISEKEIAGRKDLRQVPFITIDGETARDFDDAVFVEKQGEGYILWVAIADVSHYVTQGSELDRDARSKGTSVYFPERAFHMLPRALSENLCSLKPHVARLTLVAKMSFDRDAKLLHTDVMEAVIHSQRRATYREIQNEWDQNRNNVSWIYRPHFELFQALKKARSARGSVDFEFPEAEVVAAPSGEVKSISIRPRLDAHRLIEEFMIAANEAVTGWAMKAKWPFVYRVHDNPSLQSLEKFQALAATVGINIPLEDGVASPKVIADAVKSLEGHPAQALLNMSLLRAMKQAVYSSVYGTHFGLASQGYTHFTSPIRRYPDLVVHRMIRMILEYKAKHKSLKPSQNERIEKELAEICDHCSYRERLASDAERESIKVKQVRIMLNRLGEEFDGQVVGMVESGLFVQVREPYVEGLVSTESMADDFYIFNEEKMIFAGKRMKHIFRIGDPIRVRLVRADIERRQIDFMKV